MIDFQDVSKSFAGQTVLEGVSFRVNPGEHVGIVGPNGAGKTTVFNLITGEIQPDKGQIVVPKNCRLGYVRQQLNPHAVPLTLLGYVETAVPELREIEEDLHEVQDQLRGPDAPRRDALLRRLGELQTRFEAMGGYAARNRAEQALSGMGFAPGSFAQPFRSFSGGWQSRAELARVLVAQPDVLLLDEPSNYLDNPTIEWLQSYLREYRGTLLLISHDRYLLNSLTAATVEIAHARAERYAGNYDRYARERVQRFEQRLAAQKNQDRKRAQLDRFIERFRAKNTKATQVQSRIKQLEKMAEITLPRRIVSPGRIRLAAPPHCGVEVMRLDGAGLTYDGECWVLRGVDLRVMRGDKIALVGYNGMGKTTLLRMLAGSLPPSEGRRVVGHGVCIGYQSQDFAETMDPDKTVFDTVKSTGPDASDQEVRNLLGGFGFSGDAIEKPVQVLSGGEKIRLALARMLVRPPNLLVLDEPTTHLDIQAREILEQALHDFEGTICLVSHDIDFVRHVASNVVAMTPPGVARYAGGYEYYREKTAAGQAAERESPPQPAPRPSSAPDAGAEDETRDRKALRRERALRRQALYDQTRDLKKLVRSVEARIEKLEIERTEIVGRLASPGPATDFEDLNRRLKAVEAAIADRSRQWEAASLELERIETGNRADGGDDDSAGPERVPLPG